MNSHKNGCDIGNSIDIFADPMGATGGTILSAIDYYEKEIPGTPKHFVALHLIVNPEHLKRVLSA